jgi:ATP-dependent DNA helicase RecG
MPIEINNIAPEEVSKILGYLEGHFGDLKAKTISPAKITKSLAAFANSEGGEIYLGIREDTSTGNRYWEGFSDVEAANG